MRKLLLIILTFVLLGCSQEPSSQEIVAGWTSVPYVAPKDADREKLELDLREKILRDRISEPIHNEIVYISFGYADDGNWIEPSDRFVDRLDDLNAVSIRSVSDAKLLQSGLTSKTDGRIGHVNYVQIVEWIDERTVRLNHALYGGPLYGGGFKGAVYEYVHGEWSLKQQGQSFIL